MAIRTRLGITTRAVSAFILRQDKDGVKVLLLKRQHSKLAGTWCQVSGLMRRGETAWQACLRQIRQETGIVPDRVYSADICEQFYNAYKERIEVQPVFVAFVDSPRKVTLNHEHGDYRWLSIPEALDLLPFPGQREVLRKIEEQFLQRPPNELLRIPPKE